MNKAIKFITKFLKDNQLDRYLTKNNFDYGLIVFSLFLGFYLKLDMQNILFFSFIVWIIINPISSRLLARGTLICLSFVPLLLIIKRDSRAEQFAIMAYYFLVLTVIMAIIEFCKEQNSKIKQSIKRK